jgi:hypothetical protein
MTAGIQMKQYDKRDVVDLLNLISQVLKIEVMPQFYKAPVRDVRINADEHHGPTELSSPRPVNIGDEHFNGRISNISTGVC